MIASKDFFYLEKIDTAKEEFIDGFLSEVFPEGEQNWNRYEDAKKILNMIVSSPNKYESAIRRLSEILNL